jgi:hypothetical protein
MAAPDWRRVVGRLRRIDGMADRLRSVERRLGETGTVGEEP